MFFKDFFLKRWSIFKVFIESVTILLLSYVLVFWLRGMWDFSCPTRIEPAAPTLEGEVLTTGLPGSPKLVIFLILGSFEKWRSE